MRACAAWLLCIALSSSCRTDRKIMTWEWGRALGCWKKLPWLCYLVFSHVQWTYTRSSLNIQWTSGELHFGPLKRILQKFTRGSVNSWWTWKTYTEIHWTSNLRFTEIERCTGEHVSELQWTASEPPATRFVQLCGTVGSNQMSHSFRKILNKISASKQSRKSKIKRMAKLWNLIFR